MGIPVTTLPSGTSQGVITLSPGTSKGVVTLSVRPTPTVLPSGISKGIATLSAADPNLAVVLTAPSKTNPILVKPYAPKSTKTASAASRFSANMALNLASSPALVQQWNNNSVLWLLPYAASGNSLSTTNWVNTGQNFWSNPDTSPDLLMLDINGDGKTDVVQQWNNNGTLWLLPYISNGTSFTPTNWINTGQGYGTGPGGTSGLLALDINGDGMTDLVEQWNNNGTLYLLPYISNGTGFNTTNWINTGQGFGSGPNGTPGLVVLDINGDGKMDLVQQWNNNGAFYLLPYISNGTSFAPTNWINTGNGFGSGPGGTPGLLSLDINGDGKTDLMQQWNNNGTLWLLPYISSGTGFYTTNWINTQQNYGTGYGGTPWLLPMDLNGDGQTDLVQQWNNNGTLWLLPYISNGTSFATTNWINTQQGFAVPGLIALDINGDGKTDLVQQWNNNGTLWLLPYISSGTTLSTTNWINTGQGYGSGPNGTPGLLGGSYINPAPVIQYYTISGQVTANGAGLAGAAVTLTGNSAESTTTDADGNYAFTVPAGGTYTVTASLSGYAFSPASQTFSGVGQNQVAQAAVAAPPTCESVSPPYLGTAQLNASGTFTATATVSNASAVTFFIFNEQTQNLSSAPAYSGASVPSNTFGYQQYSVTLPFSAFQQLGSYAVVATASSPAGSASCSGKGVAFFAVVNDAAEPANLNGKSQTGCGSLAGTWNDQAGLAAGEAIDKWVLMQSGSTVSGTQTVSNGASCGDIVWQVSGQLSNAATGAFTLTATNPSVFSDGCGWVAATNVSTAITVSGAGCDSGSGTEADTFPPGYGNGTFSTTWTTNATTPSGETSIFDQWGPEGYSDQALFKGQLTTSAGAAQFAGRTVKESATSLADGCAQLDPNGLIRPVVPADLTGQWIVLPDSTYTDDWLGYGPGVVRYFQAQVGNCSLTVPQQMSISADNNSWTPYKTNQLTISVTPNGVTVQRDTASQSRTYPQ